MDFFHHLDGKKCIKDNAVKQSVCMGLMIIIFASSKDLINCFNIF
jgi:hypothetical protein